MKRILNCFMATYVMFSGFSSAQEKAENNAESEGEKQSGEAERKSYGLCEDRIKGYKIDAIKRLLALRKRISCVILYTGGIHIGFSVQNGAVLTIERPEPDSKVEIKVQDIEFFIPNMPTK